MNNGRIRPYVSGCCLDVNRLIQVIQNSITGVVGPTGPTGPTGPAPTFAIGTVTTGEPGSEASVTLTEV